MDGFKGRETRFGFEWGPARVERVASDPKAGVIVIVQTKREQVHIRVTPSGLIRVEEITKTADSGGFNA